MHKPCSRCGQTDAAQFYNGDITKHRSMWCKRCHKDYIYNLRLSRVGMTLEDYARMANAQDNKCAICKRDQSIFTRSLHIDHNHRTGKHRAILCSRCNQTIGRSEDNPQLLRDIADYIEKWQVAQ